MNQAGWNFDNRYSRLPDFFFRRQTPAEVSAPQLVILNVPLAVALGLNPEVLQRSDASAWFAGNSLPEGAEPIAQAYAGHQFGNFTMLGDGRAILLGEQLTPDGHRVDVQLKGAGRTPFSRRGDGLAALGPMLREYIISEAMAGLGVPTTRSLAVVTTGEPVYREKAFPGAVLTRIAASHIRVGTFQYAAHWGTADAVRMLADYTIRRHDPDLVAGLAEDVELQPAHYLQFLNAIIDRQASLIAKWQLCGFIHGVMNTDNMALSGETIDYGPCAFMDTYDPETVFSSIDAQGRYAYVNQPYIGAWNLARLAECLLPLFDEDEQKAVERAQEAIGQFHPIFRRYWLEGMLSKLGLFREKEGDTERIEALLAMMHRQKADYTNTFRELTLGRPERTAIVKDDAFQAWHDDWLQRRDGQPEGAEAAAVRMKTANPSVIPRNHRVEEALEAAVEHGDLSVMRRLLDVLVDPYAYSDEQEPYTEVPEACGGDSYMTFCGT